MSITSGACVVLIPENNSLPNDLPGGQHITLLYLGEENIADNLFEDLLLIVDHVVHDLSTDNLTLPVVGTDFFGENKDAHVLLMDPSSDSLAVQFRDKLIANLSIPLFTAFKLSETFPEYKPHMTLGYTSDGYVVPEDLAIPSQLQISAIGVWNGESRVSFEVKPDVTAVDDAFMHYGTPRHSGRYPWGSGDDPMQRNTSFLGFIEEKQKLGLSELEIAKAAEMTVTELRTRKTIAKGEKKRQDAAFALRQKDKGMSNVAIGVRMGIPESSVRALLNPAVLDRIDVVTTTAKFLKDQVASKKYIDVGAGTENHLGISQQKLGTAISLLKDEGYLVQYVKIPQVGNPGKYTSLKVLVPPNTDYSEMYKNRADIKTVTGFSEDGGHSFTDIVPPKSIDSSRIAVNYSETGGGDKDGLIELRRGVDDISLGDSKYAQVRIAVDGTHYLKGMAMYSDKMPDSVDLVFNTAKTDTGTKTDAFKPLKGENGVSTADEAFGSVVRQKRYIDANGNEQLSALNLVNEEGVWSTWSKNLSSQMLSKQKPQLAKAQLGLAYDEKKAEYDEIMSLTNPAIKRKLLETFSDGCDSAAVHLKAAALPRESTHVILPIPEMKDNEIYAPKYRNGETVVLVRHPHGGIFEIPTLTVNNRNKAAKEALGDAEDAVGIHPNVAKRLSGADFDGDTVLVIPNNNGLVQTSQPLKDLKDFDPKISYPGYEGMKPLSAKGKGTLMGDISNLITDMSIKKASGDELARAVKHSMVVIDAEKWALNYKLSHQENGIAALKTKYQGGSRKGASTLISRAGSDIRVPEYKPRSAQQGGPIDPVTGKKVNVPTGESYLKPETSRIGKSGRVLVTPASVETRATKTTRMAVAEDAFSLSSGTLMEATYATHANKLKALGNTARKSMLATKKTVYSPSANKTYAPQVSRLKAALNTALKNAPLERQAQLHANLAVKARMQANPGMDAADLKKIKGQELTKARLRNGASKARIDISPVEWEAIQAGAITNNFLKDILDNTDLDKVKQLATPRSSSGMTTGQVARAKAMIASGHTQSEVADALGVPVSTLSNSLK